MKTWVAILLVVLAAAAVRLPWLVYPDQVVFDEVHFGKFVTAYCCTGQRFFDIHPPHAKLLIAGTAKLLGYSSFDSAQGKGFDFDHIGEPYGNVNVLALRIFPALMGVLLPLIFFLFLRQLSVSPLLALLGGLAVALDNALVVQTRLIALDGLLLVATFGALWAYFRKNYVLAGVLAGLAAGTKFTGLAVVALLVIFTIWRVLSRQQPSGPAVPTSTPRSNKFFRSGPLLVVLGPVFRRATRQLIPLLLVFFSFAIIYLTGWWLHFALLPNGGPGDAWGTPTGNFWQDTFKLHKTMLSANYNLTATHPDESPAWSWPFMKTAIFYWSAPGGEVIYFLGNPVVWWGSTILFLIALFEQGLSLLRPRPAGVEPSVRRPGVPRRATRLIPLLGFVIAYAPLLRVPRALFLYHYLTPLVFGLAFGLVWLDQHAKSEKRKAKIMGIGIGLLIVFFVLFSPLTYGLDVPSVWRAALYWLPGWR